MSKKRITKLEINGAQSCLTGIHDLAEEIRRTEGRREANAYLSFAVTRASASRAIETLRAAKQPMPEWLKASWAHYGAMGWHSMRVAP